MDRTPHPEEPAEGASDADGTTPEHNTAPDGYATDEHSHGGAVQGDAPGDGTGGALQGDASGDGTGGAIQGDASPGRDAPLGGDRTTEEQLDADNEVEEDTLKTLDPDDPPA